MRGKGFGPAAAAVVVVLAALFLAGCGSADDGDSAPAGRGERAADGRPNFVVVMTDDLDEQSMEQLGGIREVMGSEGATFENAYVTYSLCCPSRVTFLRGQYPHNHRVLDNEPPDGGAERFRALGLDQSTIATWLDDAGYQTKYVGKYMNGSTELYVPPGWDEWFTLQRDASKNEVDDDGRSITIEGNSTDAFADETSDFIRRSSAKPDPFFVVAGTRAPHEPPEVAERHEDRFADAPLPKPPNFDEADVSDKPRWLQRRPRLSQDEIAGMQDEYRARLRSMLSVEDLLGQTIATLRETGELDNTYVLFTSDNGFHMGNHRLPSGKLTPYEEDIGVPLMVRGPGVPAGAVREQLVINNDLAPTIADLAGVTTPVFVDGSSFAPLLTGSPPATWRTAFLEEGWKNIPVHQGIHTSEHMYVEYETDERELYDLAADPYQLQSEPPSGNEEFHSDLEDRLSRLRDCAGEECRDAEFGQG